jgi:hypothetical protein
MIPLKVSKGNRARIMSPLTIRIIFGSITYGCKKQSTIKNSRICKKRE